MKKRIALIGSGELSRHIAHFATVDQQFDVVGYFDDFTSIGSIVHGYPILGGLTDIEQSYLSGHFDELVNGIGYTRMSYRKEVFERFQLKIPFATFIHSSCFIDPTAKIGKGVVIFPQSMLYMDAIIEDNVFIQICTQVTDSTIKKHTMLSANVFIAGRTQIGECCNIGVSTTVINDINICEFVTTGGGAVVTKNIIEPGLYVGVPARKIR